MDELRKTHERETTEVFFHFLKAHYAHTQKHLNLLNIFLFLSHSSIARMSWRSQVFPLRKTAKYPLFNFPKLIYTYTRTHTKIHIRTRNYTLSLCFIIQIPRICDNCFNLWLCSVSQIIEILKSKNSTDNTEEEKKKLMVWNYSASLSYFLLNLDFVWVLAYTSFMKISETI